MVLLAQIQAKIDAQGPTAQFTPEERALLASISDSSIDDNIKQTQDMGLGLMKSGLSGGPSGGTYGRYGIPMPYSRGQAIADALRTGAGSWLNQKGRQQALSRGQEVQRGKTMYDDRLSNPIQSQMEYDIRSQNQSDLAKLKPSLPPELTQSRSSRFREFLGRMF
jgi:hypothetical protein